MDEIQTHDEDTVDKAVMELQKHFDTVQVFVTRQEPNKDTLGFSRGSGNWYARYGQVNEWITNGGAMHLSEEEEEDDSTE